MTAMTSAARAISTDEANLVVPSWDEDEEARFCAVLRQTVQALDGAGVPFVLMGGIGSASHGRPRWTHDVDVFTRPEDAERALDALASLGYEVERTFPDWLFKAFKLGVMVDLIFKSAGGILLDDEMIERATSVDFKGVPVRVIPPRGPRRREGDRPRRTHAPPLA